MIKQKTLLFAFSLALTLPACTIGPNYHRPSSSEAAAFKEVKGWKMAQPSDDKLPEKWWEIFKDPYLNTLVEQVGLNNQSLKQVEAQFQQAQALVMGARAAFYPTATGSTTANRFRASSGQSVAVSGVRWLFGMVGSIAWEPDIWGAVRRQVENNQAAAQASFATLQALRLSSQATLVQSYFDLRMLDAQQKIYEDTVKTYTSTLQMIQNRYAVGVSAKSDLVQAKTQLASTRALAVNIGVQRGQLEHAIALLMGKVPGELKIPVVATLPATLPAIPMTLPSHLLERRPDIAAAERQVAAANATIGVAKAAYYPTVNLNASSGFQNGTYSNLLNTASRYWAIGPAALALPLFDGGARAAQLASSVAAFDASVAAYRQTVLNGFKEVEDYLLALRVLEEEMVVQNEAVASAQEALALINNQFKAGTVSYLDVMTAQVTTLTNLRTSLTILGQRYDAAVLLIKALGGGWSNSKIPAQDKVAGEAKWSQFLPIPIMTPKKRDP